MADPLRFLLCTSFPSIPNEHRVFTDEMGVTEKAGLAENREYVVTYKDICIDAAKRVNSGTTNNRTDQGLTRTVTDPRFSIQLLQMPGLTH